MNKPYRTKIHKKLPQNSMRKIYLFLLALMATVSSLSAQAQRTPTICGSLLFSYEWQQTGKNAYGVYAFPAEDPINYKPLAVSDNLFALGGGCLAGDRYCLVTYYDTMGALIASYEEYDIETWQEVKHYNNVGVGSIAVDMTFDPVGQKIYGCFINDTRDGYVFGVIDRNTGVREAVSNLRGPLFAMACNSKGQIYAIDSDGRLVKVDKNTGATTSVGLTGLRPYNTQSAAFDLTTDRLYWAACTQSTQGLYEVDVNNGGTTLIANFQHGEEWGGLYVAPPAASDGAPAAVENLTVTYDPTTTASATVSFTLPATTFAGEPLSGNLEYVITLDGDEVDMGDGQAGQTVTRTLYNNAVGNATIGVRCSNAEGKSPQVRATLYLGHDAPAAVENLKLQATAEGNVITWDKPTHSMHGGYCDFDEVTYRVVRQPEGRVIGNRLTTTSFTDKVDALVLSEYSYDVIPFAGSLQGESKRTEKVLIGDSFEVPYSEGFDMESNFGLFTVFDVNGDGASWIRQTDGTAQSYYSMTQAMDDWLITPPIHLTTAQLYRFAMSAKVMNGFPERLEVFIGRDRNPEAMTQCILPATDYHNASYETFESRFGVDTDGDWYIGFHCITPAEGYRMNIDWISLDADLLTAAPAAPTDLVVTPGAKGALEATVTLTAPTTAINGATLAELTQLKVYRGHKLVKSFSAPKPGEVLSFTESNLPNGMASYTAEALNTSGPGLEASAQAFVGIDTPDLPTDVTLTMVDDVPTISWTAPAKGANGGYIDPEALTYYVQRGTDDLLVAQAVSGLSATDKYFTMPAEQTEIYYYVYASSTTALGEGAPSNVVVVGPSYSLPFRESFAGGNLDHSLWGIIDTPNTGTWGIVNVGSMPMCDASDGDNGLLEFQAAAPLDESFLYSGKIDIAGAPAPLLKFDYYYYPQQLDLIEVYISTNGDNWTPIEYIDYYYEKGEAEWRTKTIDLSEHLAGLPATGDLQIGFRGVSADGVWRLHLDNIVVTADADGIHSLMASDPSNDRTGIYDLWGRKSNTFRRGTLGITSDGRKVLVK